MSVSIHEVLETLRGITAIKLFNAYDDRRAHWLNLLVETINRQLTTQKLDLLFRTANMLLLGGITILVVWLGALQVLARLATSDRRYDGGDRATRGRPLGDVQG